jgi:glycylpeptide N-tetradecanoyltransferase
MLSKEVLSRPFSRVHTRDMPLLARNRMAGLHQKFLVNCTCLGTATTTTTTPEATMADESKIDNPKGKEKATEEATEGVKADASTNVESENEEEQVDDTAAAGTPVSGAAAKKKKSKKKRIKAALTGESRENTSSNGSRDEIQKAVSGLSNDQISEILKMNPALAEQLGVGKDGDLSGSKVTESLKRLKLEDIMTGLASSGKNVKDMANYKFWQTQPVPKFGESLTEVEEGPIKVYGVEAVPKEAPPLLEGFEWVTMDLTDEKQLEELFQLLYGHYVEDDEAMFRFNYSVSFLKW